jgi:hypothetical protein
MRRFKTRDLLLSLLFITSLALQQPTQCSAQKEKSLTDQVAAIKQEHVELEKWFHDTLVADRKDQKKVEDANSRRERMTPFVELDLAEILFPHLAIGLDHSGAMGRGQVAAPFNPSQALLQTVQLSPGLLVSVGGGRRLFRCERGGVSLRHSLALRNRPRVAGHENTPIKRQGLSARSRHFR